MRRGRGRTPWSWRQSFSRMSPRQKAGRAARAGPWGWWGPAGHRPGASLGVSVPPEAEVGTIETGIPSRAVAGANWVSLSPSNRAPSLCVRKEKRGVGAIPAHDGAPRFPAQLPCPILTPPSSHAVLEVPGQDGCLALCPQLGEEQSPATPACDSSSWQPWEGVENLREKETEA